MTAFLCLALALAMLACLGLLLENRALEERLEDAERALDECTASTDDWDADWRRR